MRETYFKQTFKIFLVSRSIEFTENLGTISQSILAPSLRNLGVRTSMANSSAILCQNKTGFSAFNNTEHTLPRG